jgi:hypothetical protein
MYFVLRFLCHASTMTMHKERGEMQYRCLVLLLRCHTDCISGYRRCATHCSTRVTSLLIVVFLQHPTLLRLFQLPSSRIRQLSSIQRTNPTDQRQAQLINTRHHGSATATQLIW